MIGIVPAYNSLIIIIYLLSNIASFSREISESFYVAAVSPLHKTTFFWKDSIQALLSKSLWAHQGIQDAWKSKSKCIANRLTKVVLIAFSLAVTVTVVPSAFLHRIKSLHHLLNLYLGAASLHALFHTSKDLYKCHKYPRCKLNQFPLIQALTLFFHQCSTCIVIITACFVCWFNVKIKNHFLQYLLQGHNPLNYVVFQYENVGLD